MEVTKSLKQLNRKRLRGRAWILRRSDMRFHPNLSHPIFKSINPLTTGVSVTVELARYFTPKRAYYTMA